MELKISKNESLEQSKRAYNTWKDIWRRNAQINSSLKKITMSAVKNKGIGKQCVFIASGPSFLKQIPILKEQRDMVDIVCIDKEFQKLMDNGIKPDFVVVADAQVSYEIYCEKWVDKTENICLIANVCSNPNWGINWKGPKTYYVNKDNINSENEFMPLSGVQDCIPAASNVSNAALTYGGLVLNYDRYILCGYDFSFPIGENFYSGDDHHYKNFSLNQVRVIDKNGKLVSSSHNLSFSCRWLFEFIKNMLGFNKVVNTSEGLLDIPLMCTLKEQLNSIKCYKRKLNLKELESVITQKFTVSNDNDFEFVKEIINSEDSRVKEISIDYYMKGDEVYAEQLERRK